jgi:hypothetical protein
VVEESVGERRGRQKCREQEECGCQTNAYGVPQKVGLLGGFEVPPEASLRAQFEKAISAYFE